MTQLRRRLLLQLLILALFLPNGVFAQEAAPRPTLFPVPAGLEPAVEFMEKSL